MAVPVTTTSGFERAAPEFLFRAEMTSTAHEQYDVAADAQRFLLQIKNPDYPAKEIHVVMNWLEQLMDKGEN
jgi:hypothetical protein